MAMILLGAAGLGVLSLVLHGNGVLPFRRQLALLLEAFFLPVMGLIAVAVNAAGLRAVLPDSMGMKLAKVPGLAFLGRFAWGYKLDLAYPTALLIMVGVAVFWVLLLKDLLSPEPRLLSVSDWLNFPADQRGRKECFVRAVSVVFLAGDAVLFFKGACAGAIGSFGGGAAAPAFSAAVATAMYCCLVIFVAYVHVCLWYD